MALIKCTECGKEFSDKAAACPNCGCPIEEIIGSNDESSRANNNTCTSDDTSPSGKILDSAKALSNDALESWKNRNHATSKVSAVKVDEIHRTFQIHGSVVKNGKSSGLIGKSIKGVLALSTAGMSVMAEKAISGKKVGSNKWFNFDDLLSYELLEDDSLVTSGGVGRALIGGAIFSGAGAIAGGITATRKTKKKIESLMIKVSLNDFDTPCVLIPIITKPIKTNSKDYFNAMKEAQNILSVLEVIAHNK